MSCTGNRTLFYDPRYFCGGLGIDTREKARFVVDSLVESPMSGLEVESPTPATYDDLVTVHDPAYVDAILNGVPRHRSQNNGFGRWTPELAQSVVWSTGGVMSAVHRALTTGTNCGSASSGLHHAQFDHGNGFCTFNGLVVGARHALSMGAKRVLILDLDAHCGGGTASLIDGVVGIEQVDVSVNSFDSYRSTMNSILKMSRGETYLSDIYEALHGIENPKSIDVVIYNAGMDPHEDCRIGGMSGVTTGVLRKREEMVFSWAAEAEVPVAYVFAGGYEGGDLTRERLINLHRLTLEMSFK